MCFPVAWIKVAASQRDRALCSDLVEKKYELPLVCSYFESPGHLSPGNYPINVWSPGDPGLYKCEALVPPWVNQGLDGSPSRDGKGWWALPSPQPNKPGPVVGWGIPTGSRMGCGVSLWKQMKSLHLFCLPGRVFPRVNLPRSSCHSHMVRWDIRNPSELAPGDSNPEYLARSLAQRVSA